MWGKKQRNRKKNNKSTANSKNHSVKMFHFMYTLNYDMKCFIMSHDKKKV